MSSWIGGFNVSSCVGVGQYHTVAIGDNNVIAFGGNKFGQLGIGKGRPLCMRPVHVKNASSDAESNWKFVPLQVSCGSLHTALLVSSGEVYTWGFNDSGRLGLGNNAEDEEVRTVYVPTRVPKFGAERTCSYIACGTDHTLCIDQNGDVWTWGVGSYGNLGHGTNRNESEPRIVEALFGKVSRVVAGGAKHSACVTRKGEVYTWGHGDKGRLGNGAQRGTSTPEIVGNLSHVFSVFISCGEAHTASISDTGDLYTWGAGSYGRLGHGEEGDALSPLRVEAMARSQVIMVSCGVFHTVCVTKDGQMYSWGGGQYGKLGLDGEDNVLSPTLVNPINLGEGQAVIQAFAGPSHTVAVTANGQLFSWGDSVQGKLGHGDLSRTPTPKLVHMDPSFGLLRIAPAHIQNLAEGPKASQSDALKLGRPMGDVTVNAICKVSVGSKHTLVLTFGGAIFGWGSNEYGQVGNGTRVDVRTPVKIKLSGSTSHRVVSISAGSNHSLCCIAQGDVFAWGRGNEGQIGTGSTITEVLPVLIQGLQSERVTEVFAGDIHSAALTENGNLFTWGDPDMGKLGHGRSLVESDSSSNTVSLPRVVTGHLANRQVKQVSLGTSHTACVDQNGRVFTWGAGWQGRLGLGNTENQYLPQPVLSLQFQTVENVSCGAYHTLFVTADGDLYVCGRGDSRLGLGDTDDKLVPELNTTLRANAAFVIQAVAGEEHSLALTSDGRVWAWGKDSYGKLGLGSSRNRQQGGSAMTRIQSIPEPIESNALNLNTGRHQNQEDIKMIDTWANHSVALGQDAQIYAWGSNGNGRLGLEKLEGGQFLDSPQPVPHFIKRHEDISNSLATATAAAGAGAVTAGMLLGSAASGTAASAGDGSINAAMAGSSALGASSGATGTTSGGAGVAGAAAAAGFGAAVGAMYTAHGLNDQRELEAQIRKYLEHNKTPPLYVVQLILKSEPKQYQEPGILQCVQQLNDAETDLYDTFVALVTAEDEIQRLDYSIGLTIASTIRKLEIPGTDDSGPGGVGKSSSGNQRKGIPLLRGNNPDAGGGASRFTKNFVAKIPSNEFVFRLLLANPRYMFSFYKIYVVGQQKRNQTTNGDVRNGTNGATQQSHTSVDLPQNIDWPGLFFELASSLYVFGDPHCDHLFLTLSKMILKDELEIFMDDSLRANTGEPGLDDDAGLGIGGIYDDNAGQGTIRRSLKRFLQPKMKARSFIRLARIFFSQPSLSSWLKRNFENILRDLFGGQKSLTQSGKELNLTLDPIKVFNELKGNQSEGLVGDASRTEMLRAEVANYPEVKREIETRLDSLQEITTGFMNEIMKSLATASMEVKLLCKILHEELNEAFQNDSSATPIEFDQAIAKFLVDYLFRPAFLDPEERQILPRHFAKITQQQKRNMAHIISFMQNIVSGREYSEVWLRPLNVVITQHRSRVQSMVISLLTVPTNLLDALYADVFTEYLRHKEDLLHLQVSNRSLKYVRFALAHESASMICDTNDPLYRGARDESSGILSSKLDITAAKGFPKEYAQLKDESNFKVNLEVELRFLDIEPDSSNENRGNHGKSSSNGSMLGRMGSGSIASQVPFGSTTSVNSNSLSSFQQQHRTLRDGLRIDPVSKAPVPYWMVEGDTGAADANAKAKFFSDPSGWTAEGEDEGVRIIQQELVALPELPQDADRATLMLALQKHLNDLVNESEYRRAQNVHDAMQKLNEIAVSHGDNGFEELLKTLLDGHNRRKQAAIRLNHQLNSVKSLEKRTTVRLQELKEQRHDLKQYMAMIGSGGLGDESSLGSVEQLGENATVIGAADKGGAFLEPHDSGIKAVQQAHRTKGSGSLGNSGSSANLWKMKQDLNRQGIKIGSYGKFTLKQLLDRSVVIPLLGDIENGEMGNPDVFLKNRNNIKFVFTSRQTGFFHVSVVLGEDCILDEFDVVMSKLANLERVAKSFYNPSVLPFNFSVLQLKILLEEVTMKQLLGASKV